MGWYQRRVHGELKLSTKTIVAMEPRDSSQEDLSEILFSESPSQLSADSREEVVSRESHLTSMRRPEPSLEDSSRTLSETPSSTPSTPRERPSPPSTSSTPLRDREEPFTDSEDEQSVCSA